MAVLQFALELCVTALLLASPALSAVTIPKCKATDLNGAQGWLFSFRALATKGMASKSTDRAPGAAALFAKIAKKVVLSNRFDGQGAVVTALGTNGANLSGLSGAYTAAEGIVKYFKNENLVKNTKFFVLSNANFDFAAKLKLSIDNDAVSNTFEFKDTTMAMDKVLQWAELSRSKKNKVYVIAAFNHFPGANDQTLNYDLSKKVNILLRNGAKFVVGALDSARYDENKSLYLPALGAFEALHLRSAEIPASDRPTDFYANTGKGGNAGNKMFEDAIQKFPGGVAVQAKDVIMVGDSLMTDIAGAKKAGLKKAILVLRGLNTKEDAEKSTDTDSDPDCYVDSLTELAGLLPA